MNFYKYKYYKFKYLMEKKRQLGGHNNMNCIINLRIYDVLSELLYVKAKEDDDAKIKKFLNEIKENGFDIESKKTDELIDIIITVNKYKSGDYFDSYIDVQDAINIIKDIKNKYTYYNKHLNVVKEKIDSYQKDNDILDVMGSLNYMMSLDEMKNKLANFIKDIKIVNINSIDTNEWFTNDSNQATRILGALYLNKKIKENNSNFHVPEFIIGVNDNIDTLDIELIMNDTYLIAAKFLNGKIFSRKITGKKSANYFVNNQFLNKVGYVDLMGDPGNIIIDSVSNFPYIVDTEMNSFDTNTRINNVIHNIMIFSKYYFMCTNNIEKNKPLIINLPITI